MKGFRPRLARRKARHDCGREESQESAKKKPQIGLFARGIFLDVLVTLVRQVPDPQCEPSGRAEVCMKVGIASARGNSEHNSFSVLTKSMGDPAVDSLRQLAWPNSPCRHMTLGKRFDLSSNLWLPERLISPRRIEVNHANQRFSSLPVEGSSHSR